VTKPAPFPYSFTHGPFTLKAACVEQWVKEGVRGGRPSGTVELDGQVGRSSETVEVDRQVSGVSSEIVLGDTTGLPEIQLRTFLNALGHLTVDPS
jgi:hypothetical protein